MRFHPRAQCILKYGKKSTHNYKVLVVRGKSWPTIEVTTAVYTGYCTNWSHGGDGEQQGLGEGPSCVPRVHVPVVVDVRIRGFVNHEIMKHVQLFRHLQTGTSGLEDKWRTWTVDRSTWTFFFFLSGMLMIIMLVSTTSFPTCGTVKLKGGTSWT